MHRQDPPNGFHRLSGHAPRPFVRFVDDVFPSAVNKLHVNFEPGHGDQQRDSQGHLKIAVSRRTAAGI